jgi:gliding motility-associated-like protein
MNMKKLVLFILLSAALSISKAQPCASLTVNSTNLPCNVFNGNYSGSATVSIASGGTAPFNYTWSPSGGNAANTSTLSPGIYTVFVTDASTCAIVSKTVNITQPNIYYAAITQTNPLCWGGTGTASIQTIGGTAPSSFTWSPYGGNANSATGLGQGVFTVTMRDVNNCALTETINITEPANLVVSLVKINNTCGVTNGGATVTPAGGVLPYSYTWSPTGGNAAAASLTLSGIYTVTVSDGNNCVNSQTLSFLQASQPTLSTVSSSINCFGFSNGTATASVNGGMAPYTYTWSPYGGNTTTAVGLGPITFTVFLTDGAGCVVQRTVAIAEPTAITASTAQINILCNGGLGTASIGLSGGIPPYTYSWSPTGGNTTTASVGAGSYTVTVRDANLCALTRAYNFTQPTALAATSTQTNVFCNNAATGAASVSITGGTGGYTYTWSPSGGNNPVASTLLAGNYTLTAKDNNSCTISNSFTITQPAAIAASIAVSSITCGGQTNGSASLTVTGGNVPYNYTWSPSGGNASSASSLAAGVYSVLVQDNFACSRTFTLQINQPTPLSSTLSVTNITCNNSNNGSAVVTVSGGITPYTYTWSPISASTSSVGSLGAGTYSVIMKDASNCIRTHSFSLVNPPQYTVSANTTSAQCGGQPTASATLTVLGGVPAYSYSWIPSGGTASVATGLSGGQYSVTVVDAYSCVTQQTLSIASPPAIITTVTTIPSNCNASDGSATVTASGGAGGFTYSWSPVGGSNQGAFNLSAGQYTCYVTDLSNCQLPVTVTVATNNPSVILTSTASTICDGTSISLTAAGSSSYTWSPSASLSSSNGSLVTASPSITTVYTVTGDNQFGCSATNTISVQVFPILAPLVSVVGNNACAGNTATLFASGSSSYTWVPSTGLSNTLSSNPTATLISPIVYTVTSTDVNGCTPSTTVGLSLLPSPTLTASTTNSIFCSSGSTTLSVTGANTYTWSNGIVGSSIQVSPDTNTVFIVRGTGANGCLGEDSILINVFPAPLISLSSSTLLCFGSTATLTAAGANTYTWNNGAVGPTITDTPSLNTTYTVSGSNANGCKSSISFSLVVFKTPTISILGKREVCENERVTLTATGATNYTWSTGEQTSFVSVSFTKDTILKVSSGLAACPLGVASITLAVNPTPSVNVSPTSTSIRSGQSVKITGSGNGIQYNWSPPEGLSCTKCINPIAQPSVSTLYTVEASNAKGCVGSATVLVEIDETCGDLFTPSAFSPNGDGNNDTWCVYGNCITKMECHIFNRWGQKVFTMSDKSQCWDGTINGTMQNTGVYIFQAQITLKNGENKSLKGTFTLVK